MPDMCYRALASILLVVVAAAPVAAGTAPQAPPPDSIARLIDLWHLPVLTPDVRCRQFASTDPSGRGDDHGHYLRRDGEVAVLAEMDGPGVIVRLWSANAQGRLRVYCDGETTPRLDGPFADLFADKLPPFTAPIATRASGGCISYFPIPYAKSCRVEVAELGDPGALYYHVQYLTYPAGTPMRTFTRDLPAAEQAALRDALAVWRAPGGSPIPAAAGDRDDTSEWDLPPGEARATDLAGPSTLLTLRLAPRTPTPEVLRGLLLELAWDGGEPSVRAPVGDFFGVGFGVTPYRGLVQGWGEHGGYCHLPMPFARGARVTVRNATAFAQHVGVRTTCRPGPPVPGAGRLHAEFRWQDQVGSELFELAAVTGPGKLVGVTQALQGLGNLWYLEGNEQFTVDGEARPSIVGTGTEDFYNGGWYWNEGPIALPLHGIGIKEEWTSNRTTPWRMFVPDAVPFARGLVARIEHGSSNEVLDAYYSSVAFWYGPAQPVRAVPDSALRPPRLWQIRPPGSVGANELQWAKAPAVAWSSWHELTDLHRGLDRPLAAAFPTSHVRRDQPTFDARLAVLGGAADGERTYRATIVAPFAERFALQLRLLGVTTAHRLALDGRPLALPSPLPAPMQPGGPHQLTLGPCALGAGEHELAFTVPAGGAPLAFDALLLLPTSPYVRTFWIAPPIDSAKGDTVESVPTIEAAFLASDFDPAAAGWKRVQANEDGLDLNRLVASRAPMLAYLLAFVHAERGCTVRALLGSDDGVRLWCNGTLCWSHAIHRPMTPDADQCDVVLQPGWNRLLLKVRNDDGGYGVMLRLADPDGTLRVSHEQR